MSPLSNSVEKSAIPTVFRRALFVRLDRIGDLVLTLPTDSIAAVTSVEWWIPRGLSFVTESAIPPRQSRELAKAQTLSEILDLVRAVRKKQYDLAVVFHAPWWAGLVLWLARVPVRIGVRSQWHSFLFFNQSVRQKRSRAEVNELEYNYRLIENGLGVAPETFPREQLKLHGKSGRPALAPQGNYYVVHPGMGGSALNWSTDRYATLIADLALECPVVITGTAADEAFLAPIRAKLSGGASIIWADGKLSGSELIGLLENARAVVAPSTGVLHLAASTGVPTVGIFSQVLVQKAVRWGPKGARTAVVEPPTGSGETLESMDLISVADVHQRLRELL